MAGYTINDLKKAGSLSGQDAIPVQQNGITRQFEVGIMDNASLVKQSGSQSSGVIRKAQTFVLQSATKINFTLENAVGRIVTDNEYVDNSEAASGWKVYVVNISSIEHTVIHGANSWPVPAGEILCFYWTGSRFTLHNIVINNLTVRGDTKLLNISAVQALAAANKIPVIGTDGKLASTTAQAIVDLANVDGKINNALTDFVEIGLVRKTDANECLPTKANSVSNYILPANSENCPYSPCTITTYKRNTDRFEQICYPSATNGSPYHRMVTLSNGVYIYGDWIKMVTEIDLNNALTKYNYANATPLKASDDFNNITSEGLYFANGAVLPSNSPSGVAVAQLHNFVLHVYPQGNINRLVQELTTLNGKHKYIRFYGITAGTWTDWEKITIESDLNKYIEEIPIGKTSTSDNVFTYDFSNLEKREIYIISFVGNYANVYHYYGILFMGTTNVSIYTINKTVNINEPTIENKILTFTWNNNPTSTGIDYGFFKVTKRSL